MLKQLILVSLAIALAPWCAASAQEASAEPALAYTFTDPQLKWGPCPEFLPTGCEIAVLHGDPSKPNVDIFFKVPAGAIIPNHTHTSAERMVLVSGQLRVAYEGQPEATLDVGAYAYGPATRPHTAVCADGAPCVLFIAFEAPLDAMPVGPVSE
jgi:quercetin dioxygenase-like cupin family protein